MTNGIDEPRDREDGLAAELHEPPAAPSAFTARLANTPVRTTPMNPPTMCTPTTSSASS